MSKLKSFRSFSIEAKVMMVLAIYLVGGGLFVASEYAYYKTWKATDTQAESGFKLQNLQASAGTPLPSPSAPTVGECSDPESDWLLCEDWEDGECADQDEREVTHGNSWNECAPNAWRSDTVDQKQRWGDWYMLSTYCKGDFDCDGLVAEESNSGQYALKMSNDPYCDCECLENSGDPDWECLRRSTPAECDAQHPEKCCEDPAGFECDQAAGGNSAYVTARFQANRQVYARTYIKRSAGYDINFGELSTGKGFYLWSSNSGDGNAMNFHFECRAGQGDNRTAGDWGGEWTADTDHSYVVLTWYNGSCDYGDCFVLPEELIRCDELWPESTAADRQWHSIEMMGDMDDSTLALWVDGVKVAEEVVPSTFFNSDAVGFNKIELTNHYHNGVPHFQSMYWDDTVVSADYIGVSECLNDEEIKGACWCGVEPGENNTNSNLIYFDGYCFEGVWYEPMSGQPQQPQSCEDEDGDGFEAATCGGNDCNDADSSVYPGAEEICGDGVDQNCDNEDLECEEEEEEEEENCEEGGGAGCDVGTTVYKINTGDYDGDYNDWEADSLTYVGGGWPVNSGSDEIAGTDEDSVYQTSRHGTCNYSFPVENEAYQVKLHFAETEYSTEGRRKFDITIEGETQADNFDILSQTEAATALVEIFNNVVVEDGKLNINFSEGAGVSDPTPVISGIEILPYVEGGNEPVEPICEEHENCNNEVDDDCDGLVDDEDVEDCCRCEDKDGDGYGERGQACCTEAGEDCDDWDAEVNPGSEEICGDGIDQDCSGEDLTCLPIDEDEDGYDEESDCDDFNSNINPAMDEVCEDGLDNNCNGNVDEFCGVVIEPDVNEDGTVNIYDLVKVALNYEEAVFEEKADVNLDGMVNLEDLEFVVGEMS